MLPSPTASPSPTAISSATGPMTSAEAEGVWIKLYGFFTWATGIDAPKVAPLHPATEAYCTADTLQARFRSLSSHDPGEDRTLVKIGARYGVDL